MDRIKAYFKSKSTWWFVSNSIFIIALLILLIPASRYYVMSMFFPSPEIIQKDEAKSLTEEELNFEVFSTKGERLNIKDLLDKPIFVNVWATWCGPCVAEFPEIERLHNDYGNKVEFIILSFEEFKKILDFRKRKGFKFHMHANVSGASGIWNIQAYPTSFIISKTGKIRAYQKGAGKWNNSEVRQLLDELIAEKSLSQKN